MLPVLIAEHCVGSWNLCMQLHEETIGQTREAIVSIT